MIIVQWKDMKVLLIAMPDTVCALDPVMRVPNLGLCSIAEKIFEDREGNQY